MQGREPVTGKMPVPQVLLLKSQHYICLILCDRPLAPHTRIVSEVEGILPHSEEIIKNLSKFSKSVK